MRLDGLLDQVGQAGGGVGNGVGSDAGGGFGKAGPVQQGPGQRASQCGGVGGDGLVQHLGARSAGVERLVVVYGAGQRDEQGGRPMAQSSATVPAPARAMTKCAPASRSGMSVKKAANSAGTDAAA